MEGVIEDGFPPPAVWVPPPPLSATLGVPTATRIEVELKRKFGYIPVSTADILNGMLPEVESVAVKIAEPPPAFIVFVPSRVPEENRFTVKGPVPCPAGIVAVKVSDAPSATDDIAATRDTVGLVNNAILLDGAEVVISAEVAESVTFSSNR